MAFYGSFSALSLCQLKDNGHRFVLKIVYNVHERDTTAFLNHFTRDCMILARLQQDSVPCDNVVRQLGSMAEAMPERDMLPNWDCSVPFKKAMFVAMPFLQLNLQQLIARRKEVRADGVFFEHEEFIQIAHGLLTAVRHLQRQRVAHRDMKADNVMLKRHAGRWVAVVRSPCYTVCTVHSHSA